MKIAIDINDVLRDYTKNFSTQYRLHKDRTFDVEEIYTNDLEIVFPFESNDEYLNFVYERYAYELFGACPVVDKKRLPEFLNNWLLETIPNIDIDEPVDVMIVSTMEYGLSLPSTMFFLAKLGAKVREFYFPADSSTIWDKCDILVTANPNLLRMKPEGKIGIKINTDYNKEINADYEYNTSTEFFRDNDNIENIIKENGRN